MKLLIIDDERLFRWSVHKTLDRAGYQVLQAESIQEGKRLITGEEPEVVLLDINLPDGNGIDLLKWSKGSYPDILFLMITARSRVSDAVEAMKAGADDYLEKPMEMAALVERIRRLKEIVELRRKLLRLSKKEEQERSTIIAESPAMIEVLRLARMFAESGAQTVLLLGESGAGKEVLARYIHDRSPRKDKPFMVINCAAVPQNLLESELFGHEKGAFTDAKAQKRGILELAHEGSVFLDEIGEMDLTMQSKMLRVLEDWTFKRVGGTRDISVDIHLIAATNQNLEKLVEQKKFREDLYYRLNVFPISIPPLRERPEDIVSLATHFIDHYNRKFGKSVTGLSGEAKEKLISYSWPGNVRELRNVIERAMILQSGVLLQASGILLKTSQPASVSPMLPGVLPLAEVEKTMIKRALSITKGNVVQAARLLGISRDKLRYKIRKHQL